MKCIKCGSEVYRKEMIENGRWICGTCGERFHGTEEELKGVERDPYDVTKDVE